MRTPAEIARAIELLEYALAFTLTQGKQQLARELACTLMAIRWAGGDDTGMEDELLRNIEAEVNAARALRKSELN